MNIAIIPARGGSKRIPGKNIKEFYGKPIIAYSIAAAQASGLFSRIIVSTDDENIAEVAKQYGAEVPFMRPSKLADDFSGTVPVIIHAIEELGKLGINPEYVCCIYATAPFLLSEFLTEGYCKLINDDSVQFCFSATSFKSTIFRAFKLDEHGRCKMFWPEHYFTRSQDLNEAYYDAGQFYWGRKDSFQKYGKIFESYSLPIIIPHYLVQDIDTNDDWLRAEMMYQALLNKT
ncbi:N-acylneuraminate cytidylyltransferase [Piscirickettsia salmonis]|uniref:Pseudaminic acid CMP-transferase n=1 Tax=Piscirickettsia salmonis TaxID=1238 RepID=A0A1L6TGT5_PISSA|nr:pseudaminic acid cytidylyltransferase [Piscirickettsia salmonis]AKP72995.1 pseudaminic acid cytidylyltransferase [Piscirickettsia salmonis LF-89 = ATCC VR-1361]ALB21631.1 pseudaminic acid CMP-transferase [Piscirickettsia salmonis]ALY01836.1 pseudaminic acid cytidylyltransferase [Piscirickettsia salmonis]AMA41345.1 pseudaminic acid cytidylyltransferase [Piscirickettsia salmonis]AOS36546.1 pseudaminic acid cytidylyltransferase [Piscirickettsia salmonis]